MTPTSPARAKPSASAASFSDAMTVNGASARPASSRSSARRRHDAAVSSVEARSEIHPSWRAARRSAGSDSPPTSTGTGPGGGGFISKRGTS